MTTPSWRAEVLELTGSGYRELQAVGRALGFEPASGLAVRFKLDSTVCEASLAIISGTVVGANFTALFEGPQAVPGPTMVLRRETWGDKEDKQQNVSVEPQVGDEDFDEEVYLDTDAAEPEVKHFLRRPEARQAARWLIRHGVAKLRVGRDGVHVKVKKSPEDMEDELRGLFVRLLQLARGGALRGEILVQRGQWVLPSSVLAAVASFAVAYFAVLLKDTPFLLSGGLMVGAPAGWFASRLIRPVVQRLVSGHAASGRRARYAALALSIAAGCLACAAAAVSLTWLFP